LFIVTELPLCSVLAPSQAATPVVLRATAGLRLLPEGKGAAILAAVSALLETNYKMFSISNSSVAILHGACCLV
jgi:Golgi nucleoside diphosphatase